MSMSVPGEGHKYIIVGGGTAGCVLANRLTADKVSYHAAYKCAKIQSSGLSRLREHQEHVFFGVIMPCRCETMFKIVQ